MLWIEPEGLDRPAERGVGVALLRVARQGCKFCYAERMAGRLHAMQQHRYRNAFRSTLQPDLLEAPLRWSRPRVIFVNSMSDLFHEDVPDTYIAAVFDTIKRADHHVFQVLTKRSDRLREFAPLLSWPRNLWMGVSVENQDYVHRVRDLQRVPASFLSMEPLLGPVRRLPLAGIHWVIAGGESGPGARPMHPDWARPIRDRCQQRGVPFFFSSSRESGTMVVAARRDGQPYALKAGARAPLRDGRPR
jgi:protein gp37